MKSINEDKTSGPATRCSGYDAKGIPNLESFRKKAALSGYTLVAGSAKNTFKLEHPYRVSESYIELTDGKWLGYRIPKNLHR